MIRSKKLKIAITAATAAAMVYTSALAADVTSTTDVNVRSGPGNNYSVLTMMQKGVPATKLGESGNWVKVNVNGKTGFVYAKYIDNTSSGNSSGSSSGSSSSGSSTPNVPEASGTVYITVSGLNVRSGPGTSYSVVGSVSKNQSVTIVGSSNGWYKIKYGSGYGFISSKYTSSSAPSSGGSSNVSATTMYSTASGLNVRSGPGTSYSCIGSLSRGQQVSVVDKSSYWYKISFGGGYGYVGSSYLTATNPSAGNSSGSSSGGSTNTAPNANGSNIVAYAKSFVGYPYSYGSNGPNAFDCSGFTQYVYAHFGKTLPRSSSAQYASCPNRIAKSAIQPGDLLFFSNSSSGGNVGHVGIYIGNGQMVHAANSKTGVCIGNINSSYYTQHYIGAGRY